MVISMIAALTPDGAIGANNQLLWRLPNDMKRFKQLTTGHTVIMGRKTFESLPNGALPNRTNVVITRDRDVSFAGCEICHTIRDAIDSHRHENEIFIIGGASIYEQAITLADKLYLTYVHHTFQHADVFFPSFNADDWSILESQNQPADEFHAYPYTFVTFIKKKNLL